MQLQFGLATIKDFPEVADLINDCFVGEASYHAWSRIKDPNHVRLHGIRTTPDLIKSDLEKDRNAFIVICVDPSSTARRILGCSICRVKGNELNSKMLSIVPHLQGSGLGSKVMHEIERIAREKGCSKITIDVVKERKLLMDWYERRGFVSTGHEYIFTPETDDMCITDEPLWMVDMEKIL